MLLLPVACHPAGGAVVRFNGELLPRSVVLTRIYPLLLLVGIGTLAVAGGLRRGRPWARPGVALWLVLLPVLVLLVNASVGGSTRPLLMPMVITVLSVAGGVLAYLYYNPAAALYFERVAAHDAEVQARAQGSEDFEAWLHKPNHPGRDA